MIDKVSTISLIGQGSRLENRFSNFLSTKGYQVISLEETRKEDSPIIIFLNEQQSKDEVAVYMKEVNNLLMKSVEASYPIFIINMQSASISDMLGKNFNKLTQRCSFLVEIEVSKKFFRPFSSSSLNDQLNSKLDLIWNKIKYYLTSPFKFGYLIDKIFKHDKSTPKIGVVGLGYVGLPVAMGFSKEYNVIGFDINKEKINSLKNNFDELNQFTKSELKEASINFSSDSKLLEECNYIIVTVPTPITETQKPDLSYLKKATLTIGKNLTPQTTIVYESTVYPGTTEEVCIPILEKHSQLTSGIDFFVGYSPERINPGDNERMFINNPKVIAGQNNFTLEKIFNIYQQVIDAKVYKAPTIKVAEASKVVENIQRDINIALMNELSLIFEVMDINTYDVLEAAKTKWNFIPATPGLVGGHCIGVDPYYLIHQSKKKGYDPNFLSSARAINEFMPDHIVNTLLKLIVDHKININQLRISILGVTFKENISDTRNSKALTIVRKLKQLGISVQVCDPHADPNELSLHGDFNIYTKLHELEEADVIIVAVPHKAFNIDTTSYLKSLLKNNQGIIMDLKGILADENQANITLWRL